MAFSIEEINETVVRLAAEQAGVDGTSVFRETNFVADLNYDSLDRVEFVMRLEETFEIAVPDEGAEQVSTVGQAADLVAELLGLNVRL